MIGDDIESVYNEQIAQQKSMIQQHKYRQQKRQEMLAGEQALPSAISSGIYPMSPSECEYLVVGVSPNFEAPALRWAKDAEEMHKLSALMRESQYKEIIVLKRMLRMKSKVEWETIDADA
jgi:hypothetical protein